MKNRIDKHGKYENPKKVPLGSIIIITKGKKHSISEQASLKSKRLIGIDDLRNDNLIRYTDDIHGIEVLPEDLLIAWDGANAGTIGFGKSGFIGSTIARIRIKKGKKIYTPFLGAFLKSMSGYLRQTATGATIPHINRQALESIAIPDVEFKDQTRIAQVLSKVEGLIAKRKESLKQLDDLLKSVFLEMFGDPVRNCKKHKLSILGSYITHITSGGRGWAKYYSNDGKRFIRSLDVQMNHIGIEDIVYVDPPENKESDRTRVEPGDVLLTITGSKIGRVCFVPSGFEEAYVSQHVAIIRTYGINPIFLSYYLSMPNCGQQIIDKQQYGQAKPGLNLTQIKNFIILDPHIDIQNKFAFIFEKVKGIKLQFEQSITELENLYGSLSQKAFKGELDLSHIPVIKESQTENLSELIPQQFISAGSVQAKIPDFAEGKETLTDPDSADSDGNAPKRHFTRKDVTAIFNKESEPLSFGNLLNRLGQHEDVDLEDYEAIKTILFDLLAKGQLKQKFIEASKTLGFQAVP